MIERLPTPWGLVRLGVAPDHPKIKAVSQAFEKIAAQPGFRFLGNVEVGRDLTHDDLVRLYDAVVYAVGAQTDRRMGIPGEDLPGSWAATEFVAWYNGHPDYQELEFDLSGERAVVVGAGNVALDVVRMLALSPEEIRPTDTTDEAIEAILGSGIEEIVLLAPPRPGAGRVHHAGAEGARRARRRRRRSSIRPSSSSTPRARRRSSTTRTRAATSRCCASTPRGRPPASGGRSGCASRLAGRDPRRRSGSRRSRSSATGWSPTTDGRVSAEPTDERETIPCGIVFRSVGYLGVELPGVPFDAGRATIPNEGGRVDARRRPGVYCAGWIKRGPSGVIGTNKKDATETVDLLLEDARAGLLQRGDPSATAETVERAARRRAASSTSPTPAGRRSTPRSAAAASRTAARASSSSRGTSSRRRGSAVADSAP